MGSVRPKGSSPSVHPDEEIETSAACPICHRLLATSLLTQHVNDCIDANGVPRTFQGSSTLINSTVNDKNNFLNMPSPPPSPPSSSDSQSDDLDFEKPIQKPVALPLKTDPVLGKQKSVSMPSLSKEPRTNNHSSFAAMFNVKKEEATEQQRDVKECSGNETSIAHWLGIIGLSKHSTSLLRAGFRTVQDLQSNPPSDSTLKEHGLTTMGPRRKLLSAIAALPRPVTSRRSKSATLGAGAETSMKCEQEDEKPKRKIWAIFEPGYKADVSTPSATSSKRPRTKSTNNRSSFDAPNANIRFHPYSQRVPGTSFVVDSFGPAATDTSCSSYFLTHFHADHYGGLRKKTFPTHCKILCSVITARLLKLNLSIPDSYIQVLPYEEEIKITDTKLTGGGKVSLWTFDANHCPGAVLMLFYVHSSKRYILHSGDCRFDLNKFQNFRKLQQVISENKLDYLYLDTTYCSTQYSFPHQEHILSQAVEIAKREDSRSKKRCLFFFGTYSIGKEKVFLAVAEALDLKIYADKRKRKILDCLDLGPQYTKRIVTDPMMARIHVIPMRSLAAGNLTAYALKNGLNTHFIGRGLAVVIRPTGWTFDNKSAVTDNLQQHIGTSNDTGTVKSSSGDVINAPKGQSRHADQAIAYNLAYSEHSSYAELLGFVTWARAFKIVPTVNARSKDAADKLRALLKHVDRPLRPV